MNTIPLEEILKSLRKLHIGVIGDFCIDAYWTIDEQASEISIETGLPTRPVRKQRYALGGAGTIVNNLAAMGVGKISVFSIIGNDPFGWHIRLLLEKINADMSGLLIQQKSWDTPVYIKPIRGNKEENRLDFGNFNELDNKLAVRLMKTLQKKENQLDALIINQQLKNGIHTHKMQMLLDDFLKQTGIKIVTADCRDIAGRYKNCIYKLNAYEAARACGIKFDVAQIIPLEKTILYGKKIYNRLKKPVFVTRGSRGCIVIDKDGTHIVPGLHIIGSTDPVGAGDSFLAGITSAMAAGTSPYEAAQFGNFVAGVTVQKLFQTGTASPSEIISIGENPDYIYKPELADDPRRATFIKGTDIEIIEEFPINKKISYALFDHDGTISTLREGWEKVMEPMMVKTILGDKYKSVDEGEYSRVVNRVREYIDKTTGVQTLEQMQGLVEMVKEFGFVEKYKILDAAGYKQIYNNTLIEIVNDRLKRLAKGEHSVYDYTIKGAVEFLQYLYKAGIKLYLASGTDKCDVEKEAKALGYAEFFKGKIYGAVGNIRKEAKKIVLEKIIKDIGKENMTRLVAFGDGPVEIRESRKQGAMTVGVASNELRRFGINMAKRKRLIHAGAHYLIPDFAQLKSIVKLLGF